MSYTDAWFEYTGPDTDIDSYVHMSDLIGMESRWSFELYDYEDYLGVAQQIMAIEWGLV